MKKWRSNWNYPSCIYRTAVCGTVSFVLTPCMKLLVRRIKLIGCIALIVINRYFRTWSSAFNGLIKISD